MPFSGHLSILNRFYLLTVYPGEKRQRRREKGKILLEKKDRERRKRLGKFNVSTKKGGLI